MAAAVMHTVVQTRACMHTVIVRPHVPVDVIVSCAYIHTELVIFCPLAPDGYEAHVSHQSFELFVQHSLVLSLGFVVLSLGFVVLSLSFFIAQHSPDFQHTMTCIESIFAHHAPVMATEVFSRVLKFLFLSTTFSISHCRRAFAA